MPVLLLRRILLQSMERCFISSRNDYYLKHFEMLKGMLKQDDEHEREQEDERESQYDARMRVTGIARIIRYTKTEK